MSLFANYIYERSGKEIIESEKGFMTYYYLADGCYIEDMYVAPEYRKTGTCQEMANTIAEIAKSKGYKKLYGTIIPSTNGSTESMRLLIQYGFKLNSSVNNMIILSKSLE